VRFAVVDYDAVMTNNTLIKPDVKSFVDRYGVLCPPIHIMELMGLQKLFHPFVLFPTNPI